MSDTGPAKMSACSFNNHPGMLSGPLALNGFNFDSFLQTDLTDTTREFSELLLKVVRGKAAGSGVKQCIGDKEALRKKLGFLEIFLVQYWLISNVLNHPLSSLVYYIISYLCCFSNQVLSFQNSPIFNLKRGRNAAFLT